MKRRTAALLAGFLSSLLVATLGVTGAHATGDSTKSPTPPSVRTTITGW